MMGRMRGMPLYRDKYARLLVNGSVMMTDAEFERRTNHELLLRASGRCLIAGLGMGFVLDPLFRTCSSIVVIEKHADVIKLIAPHFPSDMTVIHADIHEWLPAKGVKFDTIYFDIWPNVCGDDVDQAKILHRKFRKHLAPGGYMQSWCKLAWKAAGRR